ncbi:MAG: glycosyltransferase family 4 protein [Sphingomonas sp.]
MRVLYVTDGFAPFAIGGMQTYARRQLETLATSGHDLISITPGGANAPNGPLAWRNIALPWPGRSLLRRFSPWRYADDLRLFSREVARVADELKPDVIYSEGPLVHALLHRDRRAAPIIFNPHGLEMYQQKGSLTDDLKSMPLRGIVADHARRADCTVSLSANGQLQRILRDRIGLPADRIAVLPNAAPESRVVTRQSSGSKFLFVGRDEPRKALPLLLDSFRDVPGATLDLVGISAASDMPPGVTAHGSIRDREAVYRFYTEADFLVLPSHAEGMPTVILEAFAAGLPAIATDVGANADLVRTGETGVLISRNDRSALADAMRGAMALPLAERARLSANAIQLANGPFSAQSARRQLLDLLDELTKVSKDR